MPKKKDNISGISSNLSESISEDLSEEINIKDFPLHHKKIGMSVSDSEEYNALGFSDVHQKDLTIELTRYLLVNGAHLIYGGDLRNGGYTNVFAELAFQYRLKQKHSEMHYSNYFAWPIHLLLKNSDLATFKKNRVKVIKLDAPVEVPEEFRDQVINADTISNKYFIGKSMTKMREKMIKGSDGRIVIGGKLSGYSGFFPGIIEEAYLSLKNNKPLFIVGAFGGASAIVIRALNGEDENKLSDEIMAWNPSLIELYAYCSREEKAKELLTMLSLFRHVGVNGLSKLNKLSKEQNDILFKTKHFYEIVYYTIVGLKNI